MKPALRFIRYCIAICFSTVFCIYSQDDILVPLDNPPIAQLTAEINLNDGTTVRGEIVHHTDSLIIVKTSLMGEVSIVRKNIRTMCEFRTGEFEARDSIAAETVTDAYTGWRSDPCDYSLMFMPTAFMQRPHTLYFRDRELLFMNLDFAPFKRLSFTAGCLFPITFDFQVLTLGAKVQLASSNTDAGTVAIAASGTAAVPMFADVPYWAATCVMSYRSLSGRLGFHGVAGIQGTQTGGVDFLVNEESNTRWQRHFLYAVGAEGQTGARSKLIVEIFNYAQFQDSANINYLSFGFRLFGERISADIGAIKPLEKELSGVFLLIPYVSVAFQIR